MSPTASITHSERRIEAGVIQARQAHALRRVSIFLPTLCHVRHGEKRVQFGRRDMRAGPKHLLLLPAGEEFGLANVPGPMGYLTDVVSFSPELLQAFRIRHGSLLDGQMARAQVASLCVPIDRHIGDAWAQLLACIASEAPAPLRVHQLEGVLLALCLAGHAGPLLSDRRDPLSARVQQLLMLDPAGDWTVSSVAERLNLGASTLRRQLAAEGRSFRDILDGVRMGVALYRLQTTGRPVGEIAEASGYASASRFAVRFRQHYGLSPRALRSAIGDRPNPERHDLVS